MKIKLYKYARGSEDKVPMACSSHAIFFVLKCIIDN